MLSKLRNPARPIREPFGKAGLILSVLALLFAMLGGAYAASHRVNKKSSAGLTAKQKKEVKKLAEQYAGKDGAPGATGANGKDGAAGANGTNGASGADGKSVAINGTAPGCGAPGGVTIEVQGVPASAKEVCNGDEGGSGLDGKSVVASPIPPGEVACEGRGGVELEVEESAEPEEICNGSVGQDAGFNYTFSTNTEEATDPGVGNLKLNNETPGLATRLLVSETDANANGLANPVHKWTTGVSAQGILTIRKAGSPATFAEYAVEGGIACLVNGQKNLPNQCGMTDEGAYDKIKVTFLAGNGTLAAADPITVAYTASGAATLPKGAIEKGSWAFSRSVEKFTVEVGGTPEEVTVGDSERILVPLPLSTPLASTITEGSKVHWAEEAGFGTFCEGTLENPIPKNSGEACVFKTELGGALFDGILRSGVWGPEGSGSNGFGLTGGVLAFAKPTGNAEGLGSFAVKG